MHHAHRQLLNARRKSGAEHHGLLALQGHVVDVGQVVRKTQVKHAVGFVHHQELDLVQFDLLRTLQVEQTSGRGHHQIGILQLGNLQLVRNAPNHVGDAHTAAMLDQLDRVMRHLLGQLTCRANDQCARCSSFEVTWVGGVLAFFALRRRLAIGQCLCTSGVKLGALLGFCGGLFLNQGVQHRQQKCSCFAGTCLA